MERDPDTGYFNFKSRNKYILQHSLRTSFPLLEGFKERIEFVGVSRRGCGTFNSSIEVEETREFVMKKTAVDGFIGEAYINPIVDVMHNVLRAGQSHSFYRDLENGLSLSHYFLCGDKDVLYMVVVTTKQFSSAYATDFIDDLPHIYDRYVADGEERDATIKRLQKNGNGMDLGAMMNKKLDNLMLYYNEENGNHVPEELREIKMKMEQNISNIRDNIGDAETILKTSEDLLEQALVFKKRAADLKKAVKPRKGLVLAAGITVTVGAVVAYYIRQKKITGEEAGAAALGVEAAAVARRKKDEDKEEEAGESDAAGKGGAVAVKAGAADTAKVGVAAAASLAARVETVGAAIVVGAASAARVETDADVAAAAVTKVETTTGIRAAAKTGIERVSEVGVVCHLGPPRMWKNYVPHIEL